MLQDSRIRDFPTEIKPGLHSEGPPIHITINGSPLEVPSNLSVLEAVENAGIPLPALCHDASLMPSGNCRLCLVEIDGHERPVASCETRLSEGMQVSTHTPELEAGRGRSWSCWLATIPAMRSMNRQTSPFINGSATTVLQVELPYELLR